MLRLDVEANTPGLAKIRAEGRLVGEWTALLRSECQRLHSTARPLCLDLAGITDCDARGRAVLRELRRNGIRLADCSPLLLGMIQEESP